MFGWKPMVGVACALPLADSLLSAFLSCAVVCALGRHRHAEKTVVCVPFSQPLH